MSGIGTKVRVLMLELTDGESDYGEDLAQSLLADFEHFAEFIWECQTPVS
jgi:hypothetical protein